MHRRGDARALLSCLMVAAALAAPRPAAAATTVVSLTFDDGLQSQYQVRPLLDARGMLGTFFVNSGLVGTSTSDYRMTWAQLHDLAADGNEIGGHALTHPHLTQLSDSQERTEICEDARNLRGQGFAALSFAYPYGDFDATTKQVVADCGYVSARKSGGVRSDNGSCANCAFAETIPPLDRLEMRAPDSIATGTSLATMQRYVTQAEANGGGWVLLVFHAICDGCNPNSTTVSQLAAFLDWLAPRSAAGTVVRTVGDVMSPAAASPPPPPADGGSPGDPAGAPAEPPPSAPPVGDASPGGPVGAPAEPAPAAPPRPPVSTAGGGAPPLPVLGGLRITPRRLHAQPGGGSIGGRGRARVAFGLAGPARVVFRVERRLRNGAYVLLPGSLAVAGVSGANRFGFRGRIGGRRLARGRYRLRAQASVAGRRSAPRHATFTLVR